MCIRSASSKFVMTTFAQERRIHLRACSKPWETIGDLTKRRFEPAGSKKQTNQKWIG